MIEVMIERWNNADGSIDYIWSIWRRGRRMKIGDKHQTAEAAEAEARSFCQRALGEEPGSVRRL